MSTFQLEEAVAVLTRTPNALAELLGGLPEPWIAENEGPDTWSPFDIVGHLIHGERTDWMSRTHHIMERGDAEPFSPFDRFAQFRESRGKSLAQLLVEFADLRAKNLEDLRSLGLDEASLDKRGRHPDLGPVTLRQLLATWVVSDLGHLRQISRVMAKRYRNEVGAWIAYIRVLDE